MNYKYQGALNDLDFARAPLEEVFGDYDKPCDPLIIEAYSVQIFKALSASNQKFDRYAMSLMYSMTCVYLESNFDLRFSRICLELTSNILNEYTFPLSDQHLLELLKVSNKFLNQCKIDIEDIENKINRNTHDV